MKISKETINVLTNYASINTNLLLKEGNKLATIAPMKNILSNTTLKDSFPNDFGIYDISEFLKILNIFDDPDVEFNDKFATIKSNGQSVKFFSADKSVLVVPEKEIKMPTPDITFQLSAEQLAMISKAATALKASDLIIKSVDSKIVIQVTDKKTDTSNEFEFTVGDTELSFNVNLKIDNLKLIPAPYTVDISSKKLSRFTCDSADLVYHVACESDSKFD